LLMMTAEATARYQEGFYSTTNCHRPWKLSSYPNGRPCAIHLLRMTTFISVINDMESQFTPPFMPAATK